MPQVSCDGFQSIDEGVYFLTLPLHLFKKKRCVCDEKPGCPVVDFFRYRPMNAIIVVATVKPCVTRPIFNDGVCVCCLSPQPGPGVCPSYLLMSSWTSVGSSFDVTIASPAQYTLVRTSQHTGGFFPVGEFFFERFTSSRRSGASAIRCMLAWKSLLAHCRPCSVSRYKGPCATP